MIFVHNNRQTNVLPDDANCKVDEENRSPLEIEKCPMGYTECSINCYMYSETKET